MALSFAVGRWDVYLLVLVRVAAMFMVVPVFGSRTIPARLKLTLSLLVAALLAPLLVATAPILLDWSSMLMSVLREVAVGLLMGFAGVLVFSAIQMAAHFVGVQIGFGFSSVIDPFSAESSSFLGPFYVLLATIIFMAADGHHALIWALVHSFQLVPLGEFSPSPVIGERLVVLSTMAFGTAIRLAIPTVGTVLLTDAAMGLIMRTIPQMNVFTVGLPLKLAVGMLSLAAVMPTTIAGLSGLTHSIVSAVSGVVQ